MLDFRFASSADIPVVHALVESAYRGASAKRGWTHEADLLDGQRSDPAALADILADRGQCLLLGFAGQALVACVQLADKGAALAYLGLITIAPDQQGAGLGKALIAAAEAAAAQRFGARRIEMTVIAQRHELIAYYARRGYAPTGEVRPFPYGDVRFGIPRRDDLAFVVLAKALT